MEKGIKTAEYLQQEILRNQTQQHSQCQSAIFNAQVQNRGRSAARNPGHGILRNRTQQHFQCQSAIFNAQAWLLHYDLLGKGVSLSANTIHSVVKTLLQHATPTGADLVSLPPQEPWSSFWWYHKIRFTGECISWNMTVGIKPQCSALVSPVPSGKVADLSLIHISEPTRR